MWSGEGGVETPGWMIDDGRVSMLAVVHLLTTDLLLFATEMPMGKAVRSVSLTCAYHLARMCPFLARSSGQSLAGPNLREPRPLGE